MNETHDGDRTSGQNSETSADTASDPTPSPNRLSSSRLTYWYRTRAARAPAPPRFVPLSELTLLPVFAGIAGLLVALALTSCLRLPLPFAVMCGLIASLCTALFNWILVSTTLLRPGSSTRFAATVPVLIVGIVIGSILAASCAIYLVPDDMYAELSEARHNALEHRFSDISDLEDRVTQLRKIVANPPRRLVKDDPAVAPLLLKRDEVQTSLDEAERAYAGELDGSSGTGRSGPGPAATAKRERRDRLREEVSRIDPLLERARSDAEAAIGTDATSAATAAKEALDGPPTLSGQTIPPTEGLAAKLDGRKRARAAAEVEPLDDGPRARLGALVGLLVRRPGTVLPTMLLILVVYTVLHLAPVLLARDADGEAVQLTDYWAARAEQEERDHLNGTNGRVPPRTGPGDR